MIKNIGIFVIFGSALLSTIFGCKKEDVVLQNPTKYSRPFNLALPLLETSINGTDLFLGKDSLIYFFIDDQNLIHAKVGYTAEANMGINFNLKRLIKNETALNNIGEFYIYIDFINELPLSGEGQIYALNDLEETVDSIFKVGNEPFFEALISNSTGVPEVPLTSILDIKLSHDQIKLWYNENVTKLNLKIISTVGGSTANPNSEDFIVFSSESTLGIKMSIELKSGTTTNK